MTTPKIKRVPKEKVAILHVCSEQKTLEQLVKSNDKLSTIITGDGNPKEGYVYKVDEMGRDIKDINEKLTGICGIVKELHEESVGVKAVIKTAREKRTEWVKIAMFIIGAVSLMFLAYNSFKGTEVSLENSKKIDNIGIPFPVTNSRGEPALFSDSLSLRYFPKDSGYVFIIKKVKNEY